MGYNVGCSLVYGLKFPYINDYEIHDEIQHKLFENTNGIVQFYSASDSCMSEQFDGQFAIILGWQAFTVPLQYSDTMEASSYAVAIPEVDTNVADVLLELTYKNIPELAEMEPDSGWFISFRGG